jgi:predicted RNA-binding Zn-ribbon protein involved in translation (DUF1610 family)
MSSRVRDLLVRGVAAAKAKEEKEARYYLEWALRLDPSIDQRIEACYWLSEISTDPVEKRNCLEQVLAYQPNHARARRSLAILDGRLNPEEIADPDRLSGREHSPQITSAQRFVCPQCGGRLTYSPDGSALVCDYCELRQQTKVDRQDQGIGFNWRDFTSSLATAEGHVHPVAMDSLECQACSAAFLLAPGALSMTCPYCASVYVAELGASRQLIPPEGMVPFELSQNEARKKALDWLSTNGFAAQARLAGLHGLYLPVWVFRLTGSLTWTYFIEDSYQSERRTGEQGVLSDDILVPASRAIPQVIWKGLNPFNLDQLVPYEASLLAGFPAEIYQIPVADASLESRLHVLEMARWRIRTSLPPKARDLAVDSSHLMVDTFKLILAPVWSSHVHYRGESHPIFMNGQTGVVSGEGRKGRLRGWLASLFKV